jgi:signal transduction histidine kinase
MANALAAVCLLLVVAALLLFAVLKREPKNEPTKQEESLVTVQIAKDECDQLRRELASGRHGSLVDRAIRHEIETECEVAK